VAGGKSETARRGARRDPAAAAAAALEAALRDRWEPDWTRLGPWPAPNGWSLAPDALRLAARLVRRWRPRHIVEFGSGFSTRVLAQACAAVGLPAGISSVDHDPEFGRAPRLDARTRAAGVRLRHQVAPLVARDCGGKLLPLYGLRPERLASTRPADLALIDGPPVNLGGREGTLYQIMDLARPGTLVLLDDAGRASERAACACWQANLGEAIAVRRLPGFARGLAAVIVREPVPRRALWERKLEATRREIEALTAPGETFILAEDGQSLPAWSGGRRAVPLVCRGGVDWGAPADSAAAARELERRRREGAGHFALLWTAAWWRETYAGFFERLRAKFRCVADHDRLLMFDLRRRPR